MVAAERRKPRVNFLPHFLPPEADKARREPQEFLCVVCGGYAIFGDGVRLLSDRLGTWWCAEHVPVDVRSPHGARP
ncbi:hypothetical protein GCM10010994_31420 [Chelatococcus reniformis]|uniref:Uncharacterized protein n=2 Tax=Chelatococcus reniformis TaxID=1494448 RepID=A0A916XFX6_9HYPH|nr:hypothetical protein GCM10010994_31420 [Chelatococcus reniformis]